MQSELMEDPLLQFQQEVERKRKEALKKVDSIPIAALIWGPNPDSNPCVAEARIVLKDALIEKGYVAHFSDELCDPSDTRSNLLQQAAQAEAYDVVFTIPESPCSIAEIHNFACFPEISHKVIAFLNNAWSDRESNMSLLELQTKSTCRIQLYDAVNLPDCIVNTALDITFRLQEIFYLQGRRAV